MATHKRNLLFANLVLTCICAAFMSTALNTALPVLSADTGIPSADAQWLVSGYALALAVFMPLSAFLATRFPTRRVYLAALAAFICGLLVCTAADALALMMIGRILQALGNALISAITQTTILAIFPKSERGQAMGWFGLSVSAAPIAAPPVAGLLVDALGWRSVFWLVAGICGVSLFFAALNMVDTIDAKRKPFDAPSFVLSALGFGGVTLGLGNAASIGVANPASWASLAIGAACVVLFARRQLMLDEPLLDVRLLADRAFALSSLGSMLLYFATMGAALLLPLYLQGSLGCTALMSAWVILPGSIATALASPVAGRVYDKLGIKWLAVIAGAALFVSNAVMAIAGEALAMGSLVPIAVLHVLRCLAAGMLTMPFTTWGNSRLKTEQMPHAAALLTLLRNVAGAVGSAVCAGLLATVGMGPAFAVMAAVSLLLLVMTPSCRN